MEGRHFKEVRREKNGGRDRQRREDEDQDLRWHLRAQEHSFGESFSFSLRQNKMLMNYRYRSTLERAADWLGAQAGQGKNSWELRLSQETVTQQLKWRIS